MVIVPFTKFHSPNYSSEEYTCTVFFPEHRTYVYSRDFQNFLEIKILRCLLIDCICSIPHIRYFLKEKPQQKRRNFPFKKKMKNPHALSFFSGRDVLFIVLNRLVPESWASTLDTIKQVRRHARLKFFRVIF